MKTASEYETADGQEDMSQEDMIQLFFPWDSETTIHLAKRFKAIVPDTYVIGDAIRARRALDATKEAYWKNRFSVL